MNQKKLRVLGFTFFSLFFFFIFKMDVYAADSSTIICYDGFPFYVSYANKTFQNSEFYTSPTDLGLIHVFSDSDRANWRTGTLNGKTFQYTSYGAYNNQGDSRSSLRCYVQTENSATSPTYTPRMCGEKFDLNQLRFVTSNNNPTDYKEQTIASNGTITLKMQATGDLATYFSRLKISYRGYNGVDDAGNGAGTVSFDNNSKTITISGILPSKSTRNSTYTIRFYIDGIQAADFPSGVNTAEAIRDCGGASGGYYLGELTTSIISESRVEISNPIKNSAVCQEVKNFTSASDAIKNGYISECSSNTITYAEREGIENRVREKLNTLRDIYSGSASSKELANENDLLCTDTRVGIPSVNANVKPFETKIVYENVGTYFGMVCVESYYVDGGVPSLVKAGMGVDYSNKVEIRKNCSIFQVGKVTMKPQCHISVSTATCLPATGTHQTWQGGENGGPTTEFDECVQACDGGSYTQSCINSCYLNTYDDTRSLSLNTLGSGINTNLSFQDNFNYEIKKVAADSDSGDNCSWSGYGTHSCGEYTVSCDSNAWYGGGGYNKYGRCDVSDSSGDILYSNGYSQYCNRNDNPCSISISKGPPGCSDNPQAEYDRDIATAKSELNNLEAVAREVSGVREYTMTLYDSKNYNAYQISGSSYDGAGTLGEPRLIITQDENITNGKSRETNATYQIGDYTQTEGLSNNYIDTVYNVQLPLTYTKVGSTEIVAIKDNVANEYYSYLTSYTDKDAGKTFYQFRKLNEDYPDVTFSAATFSKGYNYYYTNLFSDNFNVAIDDDRFTDELDKIAHVIVTVNDRAYTYALVNKYRNIEVSFVIGTNDTLSAGTRNVISFDEAGLDCYYGVYAIDIAGESNDDLELDSGEDDDGSDDTFIGEDPLKGGTDVNSLSAGLRYYYREIKLTDVFPNDRNPRWNWSGTITNTSTGTVATGAADSSVTNYLVDPVRLTTAIQNKGDSIFTNTNEYDYSYTLTRSLVSDIRNYNKIRIRGRKITYLDYSLVGNTLNDAYSYKIREWFPNLNTTNITACNNAYGGRCDNEFTAY